MRMKMLPTTDVTLLYIIYCQIVSGLLALSNGIYIYALKTFAHNRYGNFKNWFCSRKHGSNAMLIALARWTLGIIQGTAFFLFRFNIFFNYSSDNYQSDCPDGIDCLSCAIYMPIMYSLVGIGFCLEYMLLVQILKDTLTLSKTAYSNKLLKCIVAALVVPTAVANIVAFISMETQVRATLYQQDIHACTAQSGNSDLRLVASIASLYGVWLILLGLFILLLFLLKLRQVK